MSMPTLQKTWQFNVNQLVGVTGDANAAALQWHFMLKQALTGFASNPWTVLRSSNAGSVANTDLWSSVSDVHSNYDNNPHSWVVLGQSALAANFNICLDICQGYPTTLSIFVAPDGYDLTTGTVSHRPSLHARNVIGENDFQAQRGNPAYSPWAMHVMMSTDGQCTRIFDTRASGTKCMALFEKPSVTNALWVDPIIVTSFGSTSDGGTVAPTYGNLNDQAKTYAIFRAMRMWKGLYMTSLHYGGVGSAAAIGQRLTTANDLTGKWPLVRVGLYASEPASKLGSAFDLWWAPTSIADFDDWPGDGSRQFMTFGNLVVPWDGSVLVKGSG